MFATINFGDKFLWAKKRLKTVDFRSGSRDGSLLTYCYQECFAE